MRHPATHDHHGTHFRHRSRALAALAGVAALMAAPMASSGAATGSRPAPPAYKQVGDAASLNGGLLSDIAGSAFLDKDGAFHWTNALTGYEDTPANSWARTFTNTDLGAVSSGYGTSTQKVQADAFYKNPGSLCYQLDKADSHPIPSPQQDDHCDIIGVWVEPGTGTWHALINDEYQFDPWNTKGDDATIAERVSTGLHNDRVLLATSTDEGRSWQYQGPALTSAWDHNGAVDDTSSPGNTYPFGDSGPRLFVDYSTGYFYITYNVKIYQKPAARTVASWTGMARAPISGNMAPGTWQKYYNGSWSQPGVDGIDGNVGDVPGLTVSYDPATDVVAYRGTGADGSRMDYQATTVPSDHEFRVIGDDGTVYTANTMTHRFTAPDGTQLQQISYTDPATGVAVQLVGKDDQFQDGEKVVEGGIFATQTDPDTGSVRTQKINTGSTIYLDSATHRLYLPFGNNESAISYDAYSQTYRIVGYDGQVYDTADLADPTSWKDVGTNPDGSYGGYLTTLDSGSLTNQNVTGSSYLTVSDLTGRVTRVAMTPHTNQAVFTAGRLPKDTLGDAVNPTTAYDVSIGGVELGPDGGERSGASWRLVPVQNPDYAYGSGFYRLQNTTDGSYLQVGGSTPQAQRAMGAPATDGPKQADPNTSGNGGIGTPGGSDEWYVQAVAPNAQRGGATSLAGSTTYRLVNRSSGLALQFTGGKFRLSQQQPGAASQYVTFAR